MMGDPSIEQIESVFLKPFDDYPRCRTMETIVVGDGMFTPSIVRTAANRAVSSVVGYNFTFVGGNLVNNGSPAADYMLCLQKASGLSSSLGGETEAQYMARVFEKDIVTVRGNPAQYESFWAKTDITKTVSDSVKHAFNLIEIPEYAGITPETGDSVAIAVITTPWQMPVVLASMRERANELGRSYCLVPHMAWPEAANIAAMPIDDGSKPAFVYWAHPSNPSGQRYFRDQFNAHQGRWPLVNVPAEASRVEAHINLHRGTDLRPRGVE